MFDPTDFLTVARDLRSPGTRMVNTPPTIPARMRTAFGRAYYALYLLVREEISSRYHIDHRRLPHGALYTHLQSPRASSQVRELGRDLQRMYTFRRIADYDLAPDHVVKGQLEDVEVLDALIVRAEKFAAILHRLDFSPVVPLFRP